MAAKQSFENSRIVLYEGDGDVRQTIKTTLIQATFTQTLATSSLKAAQSAIFNDEADLMIVDIDNDMIEICNMMRKIRHHQIGKNPFPVSVALISNSNVKEIHQAVNSGFDILLLKPFSMTTFMGRVHHLMHHRSPFAVTSNYIGPDRRIKKRNSGNQGIEKLITVPNPLAIMASGKISVTQMNKGIKKAIIKVNERRVLANGEKISLIIEEMASRYMLNELDRKFVNNLDNLNLIGKDMDHRLRRSKFGHVAELCNTLQTVVSRVLENPMQPVAKDIELLQNLGHAIDRAFKAETSEIAAAQTISDAIRANA